MYEAQVFMTLPEFGYKSQYMNVWRKKFRSKQMAYYWCRFWAYIRDWLTWYSYPDYGIYWKVTARPKQSDVTMDIKDKQ
jgi:hypothetical protein